MIILLQLYTETEVYIWSVIGIKTREAVAQRIVELCDKNNITINALANLSALPPSTLKNIIYGVSNNSGVVTIKILCDGFGISLQEFFDCELFEAFQQEIE